MKGKEEQPRGTLALILIYLAVLTVLWISTYSKLWAGR